MFRTAKTLTIAGALIASSLVANSAQAAGWIVGLLISLVIYPLFALLGGLLGAAIFKKNLPPPPPPGTIDMPPVTPPPTTI